MKVRLGTRGSQLALIQANHISARLSAAWPELTVDVVVIRTKGDAIRHVPLSQVGGQGFFVKELEVALAEDEIDLAVHSAKDLPGQLAPGLILGAIPAREDPRDCLVSPEGKCLQELPPGATVGTSAVRRQAMVRHERPDLECRELRGNIDTRLSKLNAGEFDSMIVARAALTRLGRLDGMAVTLDEDRFVPAVAQGALALEVREDDAPIRRLVGALDDEATAAAVRAERSVLAALHGGCQLPLGVLGRPDGSNLVLHACLLSPDGTERIEAEGSGDPNDPEDLGIKVAELLYERGGTAILGQLQTG